MPEAVCKDHGSLRTDGITFAELNPSREPEKTSGLGSIEDKGTVGD